MGRIEVLEERVRQLSREELSRFREWFISYDEQLWDDQIAEDVESGRLEGPAQRALDEFYGGDAGRL